MSASPTTPPRRRRLSLRFSLRVLLLAFTAVAIGFPVWYRWPYTEEQVTYARRANGQPDQSLPPTSLVVTTWQRQWGGGRRKHGSEWTYENGQLVMLATYRDELLHGPYEHNPRGPRRLVGQYSEGARHGEWRSYLNDKPDEVTTYRNDRKEGPYQRYIFGQLYESGQYAGDLEDGVWKHFGNDGREKWQVKHFGDARQRIQEVTVDGTKTVIVFDEGANPQKINHKGVVFADRLARLASLGDIEPPELVNALSGTTEIQFVGTPINAAVTFLAEKHEIPIVLDRWTVDPDLPITEKLGGMRLSCVLALITAPQRLACDYRYGCIWITSAENAKDWRDPTGVAAIQPPPGWPGPWTAPVAIEAVELPLADVLKKLAQPLAIDVDVSAIEPADETDKQHAVTLTLKGHPLRHALGILLYQSRCRCELRGQTLVILPPNER